MDVDKIIIELRKAFKDDNIKRAVLDNEWYEENIKSNIDCTGFCYAASEVIYRLDGKKDKWKKASISKNKWDLGGHCYLVNKGTNERLDVTSEQYSRKNIQIPYEKAVFGGFRTKDFSKAARILAIKSGLIKP